jgi:hypothetical protein
MNAMTTDELQQRIASVVKRLDADSPSVLPVAPFITLSVVGRLHDILKARNVEGTARERLLACVIADITGGSIDMAEAEHAEHDASIQLIHWGAAHKKAKQNDKQAVCHAKKSGKDILPPNQTNAIMLHCYRPNFGAAPERLPCGTIVKRKPVPCARDSPDLLSTRDEVTRSLAGELQTVKAKLEVSRSMVRDSVRYRVRAEEHASRGQASAKKAKLDAAAAKEDATEAWTRQLEVEQRAAGVQVAAKTQLKAKEDELQKRGDHVVKALKAAEVAVAQKHKLLREVSGLRMQSAAVRQSRLEEERQAAKERKVAAAQLRSMEGELLRRGGQVANATQREGLATVRAGLATVRAKEATVRATEVEAHRLRLDKEAEAHEKQLRDAKTKKLAHAVMRRLAESKLAEVQETSQKRLDDRKNADEEAVGLRSRVDELEEELADLRSGSLHKRHVEAYEKLRSMPTWRGVRAAGTNRGGLQLEHAHRVASWSSMPLALHIQLSPATSPAYCALRRRGWSQLRPLTIRCARLAMR